MTANDLPPFLTTEEAAKFMRYSVDQMRRHHEQFRAIKTGGSYRFPRGVLLALSETGTLPEWHGSPQQASITAPEKGTEFAGEKTASKSKTADTPPSSKPKTAPMRSNGAFARDFPEFAHLAS